MTEERDPHLARLFAEAPEPQADEAFVDAVRMGMARGRRMDLAGALAMSAAVGLTCVALAGPVAQAVGQVAGQVAPVMAELFDVPGGEILAVAFAGLMAVSAMVLSRVRV